MTDRRLTNRRILKAHRARAKTIARDPFLHDEAMSELSERLAEVNRTFTKPAIVTGHPQIWSPFLPEAKLVADEDVLDLTPEAHDLVIHAMALHWADDPVGQIIQCRRALTPDGLLMVVCFGENTLTELRQALALAENDVRGGASPHVAPMADLRAYGALLQRAGLALPVADISPRSVDYADLSALVADLRAMGETNALLTRDPRPLTKRIWNETVRNYADRSPGQTSRYGASFDLIFLTGWAPAASQPKPLRPGSATSRLADALGAVEVNPNIKSGISR